MLRHRDRGWMLEMHTSWPCLQVRWPCPRSCRWCYPYQMPPIAPGVLALACGGLTSAIGFRSREIRAGGREGNAQAWPASAESIAAVTPMPAIARSYLSSRPRSKISSSLACSQQTQASHQQHFWHSDNSQWNVHIQKITQRDVRLQGPLKSHCIAMESCKQRSVWDGAKLKSCC